MQFLEGFQDVADMDPAEVLRTAVQEAKSPEQIKQQVEAFLERQRMLLEALPDDKSTLSS